MRHIVLRDGEVLDGAVFDATVENWSFQVETGAHVIVRNCLFIGTAAEQPPQWWLEQQHGH